MSDEQRAERATFIEEYRKAETPRSRAWLITVVCSQKKPSRENMQKAMVLAVQLGVWDRTFAQWLTAQGASPERVAEIQAEAEALLERIGLTPLPAAEDPVETETEEEGTGT